MLSTKPNKPRKCRWCGIMTTRRPIFCCWKCEDLARKERKAKRKAIAKDQPKKRSDLVLELQAVFNKWIVERDKHLPCITCPEVNQKLQAGHYKTVGANPELRFNEDNCHGQCETCNISLGGNVDKYRENLPKKIGIERFNDIEYRVYQPAKLNTEELENMIKYYTIEV